MIFAVNSLLYLNQSVPPYGVSLNSLTAGTTVFPLRKDPHHGGFGGIWGEVGVPRCHPPTPRAPRRHAGGGEADAGLRPSRLHLLRQDGDLAEGGGDVSATQPPHHTGGTGGGSRAAPPNPVPILLPTATS